MKDHDEIGHLTKYDAFMYQSIPKPPIPPRATPGHLTRVKLRTVGNLTQNEARPVGHLTFKGHCSRRFHVKRTFLLKLEPP